MTRPQGSGGLKYYEADRLSTRLVTSSTGAVLGTQDHLPFGEEAGVAGESEKHRFTNYERDGESGTDYAVNRQYGLSTGRFMQPDPVAANEAIPQSLNRYAYSLNDPINLTDPLGLNVSADEGYDCTCTRFHYSNPATGEGYWGAWSCSCTPAGGGGGGGGGGGPQKRSDTSGDKDIKPPGVKTEFLTPCVQKYLSKFLGDNRSPGSKYREIIFHPSLPVTHGHLQVLVISFPSTRANINRTPWRESP